MFAIVICLVLPMCTLTIRSYLLCVSIIECISVVVNAMLSLMYVQPIVSHRRESMYFGCFDFRVSLVSRTVDDVCMCVANKQPELPEFVFESVYVDMQYDEISLTPTAGYV